MRRKLRILDRKGFTLLEVMIAVAILGSALFLLLEAHYGALDLFTDVRDESVRSGLIERAIVLAEIDVQSGILSGDGEFGDRFEDWTYTFRAEPMGEGDEGLYQVEVKIIAPDQREEDAVSKTMFVYSVL